MNVSLVTGAGSGIGEAVARSLADRGDAVVCADLDLSKASSVARRLPHGSAQLLDVRDAHACRDVAKAAYDEFGRIDALVTCAGISEHSPAADVSDEAFSRVLDVNLKGSFFAAQAVQPYMSMQHCGRIALIGSVNSVIAHPDTVAYCASKGGVLMLARALAVEWASDGITVNCIGPGVVDTPMSARSGSLTDPDRRASLMSHIPLRRPAASLEIATVASFLTSGAASYITGAFIPVDGGWLAAA